MKKIIADILVAIAVLLLCACAGCTLIDDTLHPWAADDPRWPTSGGGDGLTNEEVFGEQW